MSNEELRALAMEIASGNTLSWPTIEKVPEWRQEAIDYIADIERRNGIEN